jgi:serine protease Do
VDSKQREVLTAGRRVLFASAAGIAMVVLLAGPGGYYPSGFPAWNSSAQATEAMQQSSANFADLVAKVKPAVI